MFSLIVGGEWSENRDTMLGSRLFEHTDERVTALFKDGERPNFEKLLRVPALLAEEHGHEPEVQVARVVRLIDARFSGRDIVLEYVPDPGVPTLTNAELKELAGDLHIGELEMSRTHWAVKDVDLFRVLLVRHQPRRLRPKVFSLLDPERIEPSLVSAMMPFHPTFDPVYQVLKEAAEAAELRCRRADDIWENPAVIQDVVSLIDRSRVVVCDCSGRNPNVFYEAGIAHSLGREVILITQNDSDIPFDLRHLRYVHYLNNGEGRADLQAKLTQRLKVLAG